MQFGKVAVTGGSGRLGRFVIDELGGSADVTVVDVQQPHGSDVGYVNASTLDFESLERVFTGHDAVLHLAAIPNPRSAPSHITFNVNVQGTWNVLQAAENCGVKRVVVASSDSAVGLNFNPSDWQMQYLPVDESHPLRPSECYGVSKEVTELICRRFAQRGKMEVVVLRPTHIVFAPEYPELGERGGDVRNYHLWCYVHPADVAQAFRLALSKEELAFDIFFISAAETLSVRPTLDMLRERLGHLPELRKPELYEGNPFASIFDISRAREVLGYQPRHCWKDMAATASVPTKPQ
ncbi:NAD(P)-dependent oxidoreductase [Aminobacter sp. MSH1]|uniref:NAD-dependent epimerase/dehydratase family protein n=1 Tax=Aminobacter sp. MSH1 TaxID=374606 RepID=UPI00131EDE22|nr:NAD(P)-dependent oxidoreductase [Aminobacter sp. MSH1]